MPNEARTFLTFENARLPGNLRDEEYSTGAKLSRHMNRAIVCCSVLAIALGIFFRCYALNRPLFWQDETATSIHVTGHDAMTYGKLFDGNIHPVAEVLRFARVDPSKNAFDVASVMAREDPQHVPVYYMLERIAIGFAGTSVSAMRALSVFCGIAAIALAFVLGRQLGDLRTGAIAASLVALSPLFVLMSRQAREYALFVDVCLLATIVFVRASRGGRTIDWIVYAVTVSLGTYCDLLFPLVALGHGIAAVARGEGRTRGALAWLVATLAGCATFVPWLLASAGAKSRAAGSQEWIESTYSALVLAEKTAFNYGALVFDGEFKYLRLAPLAIVALAICAAVAVYGTRAAGGLSRSVPLAIALPTPLALGAVDLIARTHFATIPRYLVGTWVGIELAVAIGLALAFERRRLRTAAFSAWIVLLGLGIAAAAMRGGAENWWDNGDGVAYQALARTIGRTPQPLVASDGRWNTPLELARYLPDDAQFLLFETERGIPQLPTGRTAFAVAPPAGELRGLTRGGSYRISNASPAAGSNLQQLSKSAHASPAGDDTRPDNALWLIVPVAKRAN